MRKTFTAVLLRLSVTVQAGETISVYKTPTCGCCQERVADVDGYVVEGHVPAPDIERLLNERPDIVGISVPPMPIGSPGMEHRERGDNFAAIDFEKDGSTDVFFLRGPAHD